MGCSRSGFEFYHRLTIVVMTQGCAKLKFKKSVETITEIEISINQAQNKPCEAFIEGRNHESSLSFIMTGIGKNRTEAIEMARKRDL